VPQYGIKQSGLVLLDALQTMLVYLLGGQYFLPRPGRPAPIK